MDREDVLYTFNQVTLLTQFSEEPHLKIAVSRLR